MDLSGLNKLDKGMWSDDNRSQIALNNLLPGSKISSFMLARWCASQGEWGEARKYLQYFIDDLSDTSLPKNSAPTLLALSILCKCGELKTAKSLLDRSLFLNSSSSDFYLASCLIFQVEGGNDLKSLYLLNRIFNNVGLAKLGLISNSLSLDSLKTDLVLDKTEGPLVTVIIPSYNSSDVLFTAVNSLLAQTWKNLEIIIVDDASTDDSLKVAKQLSNLDARIKLYAQHVNQGAYVARNVGLYHAQGDFITVHDADDYSHCQKIQLQVEALLDNENFSASVSHWARCSTDLKFGTWRQEASWVHRNVSSLMFRRSVFNSLGYWDAVSVNADTEYYYRILSAYGNASIVEVKRGIPLAFGRTDGEGLTQNPKTHLRTQFKGVRKDYMDAAHEWHKSKYKASGLYMPFKVKERFFEAPKYIKREVCFLGYADDLGVLSVPYYLGHQHKSSNEPTVLLCAHMVGETLYGAERSFIDMAKSLHEGGKKLIIALPSHGSVEYRKELLKYCAALVVVGYKWWKPSSSGSQSVVRQLMHVINEFKVRLVAVNTLVIHAPLLAAKSLNIPTIMHVRELPEHDPDLCKLLSSSADDIRLKLASAADTYVANSFFTSNYIAQPNKSHVLHNTVNVNEFNIPLPKGDDGLVRFALISSNTAKKGVEDFLNLARRAVEACPNARFLLVGPVNKYIDSLMELVPENVEVCGYKATPQEALLKADVVLNLSHFQESFGRTVSEAMAAQRPVIAYRWGAIPELIDNGINGYLVTYSDIDGLLSRVKILANDTNYRRELGQEAMQKMIKKFSFDNYLIKINKIYQQYLEV